RDRHHQPLRALLHPGQRNRAYRIAIASRRECDQSLFSAGDQSRFSSDDHLQSGDGAVAATATGDSATGGAEVRRLQLACLAGDVQLGLLDYNIYTNSQLRSIAEINQLPLKTVRQSPVRVEDIGSAKDAQQIQTNLVRVDGQRSVYVPVLKQGGDTNTIAVVDGIKHAVQHLFDVPRELITRVVFDQ